MYAKDYVFQDFPTPEIYTSDSDCSVQHTKPSLVCALVYMVVYMYIVQSHMRQLVFTAFGKLCYFAFGVCYVTLDFALMLLSHSRMLDHSRN